MRERERAVEEEGGSSDEVLSPAAALSSSHLEAGRPWRGLEAWLH